MKHEKNGIGSPVRPTLHDYFELMRLPNVFTAIADVAMGFLFVGEPVEGAHFILLAFFLASSGLLYLAGVVLNDVFDMELDSHERPYRPLPSGRIPLDTARRLGWQLLIVGTGLGWAAAFLNGDMHTGIVVTILAICIVIYDAKIKSTVFGPVLMGVCRMLNVLFGMSAASALFAGEHWAVAGAIGLYITGVTWFSRTETDRSARLPLALSTIIMMLGVVLLG